MAPSFVSLVLTPLLFNIYMKLLGKIIRYHGTRYHQYANDTQLYIAVLGEMSDAVGTLLWCLEAVEVSVGNNRFQLNSSKM